MIAYAGAKMAIHAIEEPEKVGIEVGRGSLHRKAFTKRSVLGRIEHLANRR